MDKFHQLFQIKITNANNQFLTTSTTYIMRWVCILHIRTKMVRIADWPGGQNRTADDHKVI